MAETKKSHASKGGQSESSHADGRGHSSRRWVREVKTDSTHPRPGLFKEDAGTIARELASKKVSPKGPGSGMRMLTYYINRAGKGLSASRKKELEHAKELLHKKTQDARRNREQRA